MTNTPFDQIRVACDHVMFYVFGPGLNIVFCVRCVAKSVCGEPKADS